VFSPGVVYRDDADNREDHVDRKQARAFEGFVTEPGDALLRMATLLTTDPDAAEDVYRKRCTGWPCADRGWTAPGRSAGG
jgi:hypothetical protein